MYFTQEDYRKIEAYLKSKAARDTSFDSATTPLQGNETIVLVQGGKNVNTTVSDIVSQFFALGVSDFINVTDKYGISYNTLDEAIRVIPWRSRKVGQVITFLNEQGEWHLYQYQGESVLTWNNTTLWVDLLESRIVNSILPDQEDLTMTEPDADGNSYMHFKDKDYSIDDFSGLGRVYLRKNLQTLTDPNTGETRLINYLTQTMIGKENVIYHIQYDYNLNGQTIIIPEGCVLLFEGGSISNGTITGQGTSIVANLNSIFKAPISLGGTWNIQEVYPEWFGAIGDNTIDDTTFIQKAIDVAYDISVFNVVLNSSYKISDTLKVYSKISIGGTNNRNLSAKGAFKSTISQSKPNTPMIKLTYGSRDSQTIRIDIHNLYLTSSSGNKDNIIALLYDSSDGDIGNGLSSCSFTNVYARGVKIGFKAILSKASEGFTFCTFNGCAFDYNTVGFSIDGGMLSNNTWFNLNSFNDCSFTRNTRFGVLIERCYLTQDDTFTGCSFERNGTDYDYEDYLTNGCAAIKVTNGIYNLILNNCYIENNAPRRSGTATSGEVTSSTGYIMPENYYDSDNAAFILTRAGITIHNSILASDKFFIVKEAGSVILKDNAINTGLDKINSYVPDYLIDAEILDTGISSSNFDIVHRFTTPQRRVAKTFNKFIITNGNTSSNVSLLGFKIDTLFAEDTKIEYGTGKNLSDSFNAFLNKNTGKSYNMGFNSSNPCMCFGNLLRRAGAIISNKKATVTLTGDSYFGNSYDAETSKIENAELSLNGHNFNININETGNEQTIPLYNCEINFNNINFTCSVSNSKIPISLSNSTISFNNCAFNISSNSGSFLNCIAGTNNTIIFNNCTFNGIASTTYNIVHNGITGNAVIYQNNSVFTNVTSNIIGDGINTDGTLTSKVVIV